MVARLPALPPNYHDTRDKLHVVAARVLSAARYAAVGKMGLEVVAGGFATPEFTGRRLTLTHGVLGDGQRSRPLTTLADACAFAGVDPDADLPHALSVTADASMDVSVDRDAAVVLGDWYGLTLDALEQMTRRCSPGDNPSPIQLWPEHFDVALEMGNESTRANYGGSPGDDYISEPYVYVGPFVPRAGDFWTATFGAALTYADVRRGADPLEFLLEGRSLLR